MPYIHTSAARYYAGILSPTNPLHSPSPSAACKGLSNNDRSCGPRGNSMCMENKKKGGLCGAGLSRCRPDGEFCVSHCVPCMAPPPSVFINMSTVECVRDSLHTDGVPPSVLAECCGQYGICGTGEECNVLCQCALSGLKSKCNGELLDCWIYQTWISGRPEGDDIHFMTHHLLEAGGLFISPEYQCLIPGFKILPFITAN